MKIVPKGDQQVVVFEDQDEKLKHDFLREMAKIEVVRLQALEANTHYVTARQLLVDAVEKLEATYEGSREAIWKPVKDQLKKDLKGGIIPGLAYNKDEGLVVAVDEQDPQLSDVEKCQVRNSLIKTGGEGYAN